MVERASNPRFDAALRNTVDEIRLLTRPMSDMLRAYADSQRCPTRFQDGRYEVFIGGQWVDMPEDYVGLRLLIGKPQI